MPLKRIPIPSQDAGNWGTILNDHLSQTQNPLNGAFNSFDQFLSRPTNLTADDAGRTYLYTQTGNWHEWSGTEWKVQNKSEINVKDYGAIGNGVTDDTAAIQQVLSSLIKGGRVYVPMGRYKMSLPLSFQPNTTMYGDGQNNSSDVGTVFLFSGSGLVLETGFPLNVNLSDFAIIGSGVGDGMRVIKNAFCKFENLFIPHPLKT